jgi:hypothetical protein
MDVDCIGARRRPNNSMQRTTLRAAADAERYGSGRLVYVSLR